MTEHEHVYLSECCEVPALSGPDTTQRWYGLLGLCGMCLEAAPFWCEECEEERRVDNGH